MVVGGLLYTKDHVWLKIEDGIVTIGITDCSQQMLGDIVFVNLPEMPAKIHMSDVVAVAECKDIESEVLSPVGGTIIGVNDELKAKPALINEDCYKTGWICRIKIDKKRPIAELMDAKRYEDFLEGF